MSISEKKRFTITWQIQNFSMCSEKTGVCIKSPVFVVHTLKNSEWCLEFYPKGDKEEGYLTCRVPCSGIGYYSGDMQIGYSFTLFSSDTEKCLTKEAENAMKCGDRWGFPQCFKRDNIFKDKDAYLPNDTLTLKCSLWATDDSVSKVSVPDVLKKDIFAKISGDYSEEFEPCDGFFFQTRIPVVKKTFSWPIRNFSSIRSNRKLTTGIHSVLRDTPSLLVTLYKADDQKAEIEIRKTKTESSTLVKCKVSVIHVPKSLGCFAEDQCLLEPDAKDDDVWKFPSFLDLSKLLKQNYFLKTNDVLHLEFELTFSTLHNRNQCEELQEVAKDSNKGNLEFFKNNSSIDELGQLYRDGARSDGTLRVGDWEFQVHKLILQARSPVFSAMFDKDMKEKKTGTVDITDVDSHIVDKMLEFMYTNAMEDVDVESACKLYSAADKYEVLPLKLRCTMILESTLSVSSVCEVLNLADLHHDEYLHSYAERFVQDNANEILKSKNWEDFMSTNLKVAAKVMHKILVNIT